MSSQKELGWGWQLCVTHAGSERDPCSKLFQTRLAPGELFQRSRPSRKSVSKRRNYVPETMDHHDLTLFSHLIGKHTWLNCTRLLDNRNQLYQQIFFGSRSIELEERSQSHNYKRRRAISSCIQIPTLVKQRSPSQNLARGQGLPDAQLRLGYIPNKLK